MASCACRRGGGGAYNYRDDDNTLPFKLILNLLM